jgi:hypothetical protein
VTERGISFAHCFLYSCEWVLLYVRPESRVCTSKYLSVSSYPSTLDGVSILPMSQTCCCFRRLRLHCPCISPVDLRVDIEQVGVGRCRTPILVPRRPMRVQPQWASCIGCSSFYWASDSMSSWCTEVPPWTENGKQRERLEDDSQFVKRFRYDERLRNMEDLKRNSVLH